MSTMERLMSEYTMATINVIPLLAMKAMVTEVLVLDIDNTIRKSVVGFNSGIQLNRSITALLKVQRENIGTVL